MKKLFIAIILVWIIANLPALGAQEPLGTYQVSLNQAVSPNNAANAILAAQILNNTRVLPGETFSYNKIIGRSTADRGFVKGIMYNKYGKSIYDIGSGICMTSSILHQAVKASGLEVIERHNHIKQTPYLPRGEDAAIWYGVQDYKFKNNTSDQLLIEAVVLDNNLLVCINKVIPEKNYRLHIKLGTQQIDKDLTLLFDNNISYVPLRALAEALGANIYWNAATGIAEIQKGYYTIKLAVDKHKIIINNSKVDMDFAARIINGQTMVSVRSIGKAMGLIVAWDENSKTISIKSPKTNNHSQQVQEDVAYLTIQ